ncbi:MAG: immunoglobulin domain-containing protein, partial [Opitutaceae bacterium]
MRPPLFFYLGLSAAALSLRAQTQVNLSVNVGTVVRVADDRMFSLNAEMWDSSFTDSATLPLLQGAEVRALRFPGGSLSDGYNWQTNMDDTITQYNSTTKPDTDLGPQGWTWAVDFDTFEATAMALGAQVMITTNYGSGTPTEAANWVQYANVTHDYGVKYWEIGNEVYGTWEIDTNNVPHDPYTYATRAAQYITAMKGVDPTIKIGMVAVPGEDSDANNTLHPATNPVTDQVHNGWTPVMLATLKSLGVMPDFLIYHRYEQNPGQENDAALLQDADPGSSGGGWQSAATSLRTQLNDYLGQATASQIELLCTENNSVSSNPGKQSVSLVNGLYYADSLGSLAQTEFNSLFWWTLRNGPSATAGNYSSSLYGWRQYGDYGVVSGGAWTGTNSSESITVGDSTADDQYPAYKVMKVLTHFARGGDSIVQATSTNPLLSVYAAHRTDGSLSLLVINKTPPTAGDPTAGTLAGNFTLSGFTPGPPATVYSYGVPQDAAAETDAANDVSATNDPAADVQTTSGVAVAGTSFSMNFAPYSVTVLSIPPPVAPAFTSQPASVTIPSGGTVVFTIVASGYPSPTYQWDFDGSPISGATSSRYVISGVADADAGTYTCAATNSVNSVTSSGATLTVMDSSDPNYTDPGHLINSSVLNTAGSGGALLTVGFVSGGLPSGAGSQTLLIRGMGPTLAGKPYLVPGVLPDPTLTVTATSATPNVVVATNAGWGTPSSNEEAVAAADSATYAFAPVSTTSLDSAVVVTEPAGNYTAEIGSTSGDSGTALAEIYDDTTGTFNDTTMPRLVNVSAKTDLAAGATLTAGFVISGKTARTVMIRAVGPSLVNYGQT